MYQEVTQELSDFIKATGKSQQQIAKETALSPSVISQFLKQSYKGDNEAVARTVSQYLKMAERRITETKHACFYKDMQNTQKVLFACFHAHCHGEIVLVYGDAGAGKTTALEYYTKDYSGVVMVTANSCTSSAASILQMIARKTGKVLAGKKELLMASLVDYFKNTGRLIIIDEADHLTLSALQAIRNLNDQAGIGIVLSGNNKIYTQMLQGSRCSELDQLRTRIVVRRMVRNEYSLEEFRMIFPEVPAECLPYLIKLSTDESLRTTIKILELAYKYTNELDVKTLQAVRQQLTEGI
ncbi:MAG: AAA family ATPase [Lachnospiraceae bacterium]|nr:AAA family ATPase [Lachnospiraceae bacterium]